MHICEVVWWYHGEVAELRFADGTITYVPRDVYLQLEESPQRDMLFKQEIESRDPPQDIRKPKPELH